MDPVEKRRIGRELKTFLAVNGIARETFAERAGLGKSTVDKLITGIFSDATLAKVLEKSAFRLRTNYAAKIIGNYSRLNWEGYVSDYLMLHASLDDDRAIEAVRARVRWDDMLPGLVLVREGGGTWDTIGALWIPHERSPLIYIQPTDDIGVRLIVTTMIGEAVMRGIMLAVENRIANAWVPVAAPVVLRRADFSAAQSELGLGSIDPAHDLYQSYAAELVTVSRRHFGRFATSAFASAV